MRLLILFFLFPFITFGQNSEKNEKIQKRNDRYSNTYRYSRPNNNWNNYRYVPPVRHYWNSPYIYSPWRNDIWYPPQPQINNYYYNNSTPQLSPNYSIPIERYNPVQNTLGMSFSFAREHEMGLGVYYSVGRENVFIMGYKFPVSSFDYYGNISLYDVIRWNDRYVKTNKTFSELTIGYGKKINHLTPYISAGFVTEKEFPQYFDELYILGNNGYYNILGDSRTTPQISVGTLLNWEVLNGNISVSILSVQNLTIGFGFNF